MEASGWDAGGWGAGDVGAYAVAALGSIDIPQGVPSLTREPRNRLDRFRGEFRQPSPLSSPGLEAVDEGDLQALNNINILGNARTSSRESQYSP